MTGKTGTSEEGARGIDAPDVPQLGDPAPLLALLTRLQIRFRRYTHPPLHSVDESRALRGDMPGLHVKNLFLKARKGGLVLVTCREDRRIRIVDLEKEIGTKRLSFASADLLAVHLGVSPGAVTPLALINDRACAVRLVLDTALRDAPLLNCHPLHNAATIGLSTADLLRVFAQTGHRPAWVDFDALEARAATGPLAPGAHISK